MKIKIGIIGVGRIGKFHIEHLVSLRDKYEITAIADEYSSELSALQEQYQIPHAYKDYQDLLNDPNVEAVAICSPTDTHAPISIAAAEKGKNIFWEKPIDHSIERIKEVVQAVEKNGVKLQVGFNRRFDRNFATIQQQIVGGKIGDPQIVKVTSRDPEPPSADYVKSSGGLFMDMTIHDFDMVRYLSNSEVVSVEVMGANLVSDEIKALGDIDTAVINLRFANGALGQIDNCRKAVYGYDQRAEVLGSNGQVAAYNDTKSNTEIFTEEGIQKEVLPHFFLDRYGDAYKAEFIEFYQAIKENRKPSVNEIDGLRAVEIAKACEISLKEKRVVELTDSMK